MITFGNAVSFHSQNLGLSEVEEAVLASERLGFRSVWFTDHMTPPFHHWSESPFECWTLMTAMAMKTQKIRLGTLVLCNQLRHPAVVAKIATTFDLISNGRLDIGIGTGWWEEDYSFLGIPLSPPIVRVQMMEEAVKIIKEIWLKNRVSFKGKYYAINDVDTSLAVGFKSKQKPHPPIWIGVAGKKTIRIGAQLANCVNLVNVTPEQCKQKLELLDYYCQEFNRRPADIRRTLLFRHALIARTEEEVKQKINQLKEEIVFDGTPLQTKIDQGLFGTPNQCINKLQKYIDAGIDYFQIFLHDNPSQESLEYFAETVIPSFAGR